MDSWIHLKSIRRGIRLVALTILHGKTKVTVNKRIVFKIKNDLNFIIKYEICTEAVGLRIFFKKRKVDIVGT